VEIEGLYSGHRASWLLPARVANPRYGRLKHAIPPSEIFVLFLWHQVCNEDRAPAGQDAQPFTDHCLPWPMREFQDLESSDEVVN